MDIDNQLWVYKVLIWSNWIDADPTGPATAIEIERYVVSERRCRDEIIQQMENKFGSKHRTHGWTVTSVPNTHRLHPILIRNYRNGQ